MVDRICTPVKCIDLKNREKSTNWGTPVLAVVGGGFAIQAAAKEAGKFVSEHPLGALLFAVTAAAAYHLKQEMVGRPIELKPEEPYRSNDPYKGFVSHRDWLFQKEQEAVWKAAFAIIPMGAALMSVGEAKRSEFQNKRNDFSLEGLEPASDWLRGQLDAFLDLKGIRGRIVSRELAKHLEAEALRWFTSAEPEESRIFRPINPNETFNAAYGIYHGSDGVSLPYSNTEWFDLFAAHITERPEELMPAFSRPPPDQSWLYDGWLHRGGVTHTGGEEGRFYLSANFSRPEEAATFWEALKTKQRELRETWAAETEIKINLLAEDQGRSDGIVVYFGADNEGIVYDVMIDWVDTQAATMRDSIPAFAAQVLNSQGRPVRGLAFAQSPSYFQTFGQIRAYALTLASRKIAQLIERGVVLTSDDAYNIMKLYLKRFGIDAEHPAFKVNGREAFPHIWEHTDQGRRVVEIVDTGSTSLSRNTPTRYPLFDVVNRRNLFEMQMLPELFDDTTPNPELSDPVVTTLAREVPDFIEVEDPEEPEEPIRPFNDTPYELDGSDFYPPAVRWILRLFGKLK